MLIDGKSKEYRRVSDVSDIIYAVSYTHLDVYKRQDLHLDETGVYLPAAYLSADTIHLPMC